MNVQINNNAYEYYDQIVDMEEIRASFIKLIKDSFEYDFSTWYTMGGWTEKYEPHVLVKNHEVVATITVNHVRYEYQGIEKYYIQLGGVLTRKDYRGCGLSAWLMNQIIARYQDQCDQIYLLCNDSAVNFYPKFGFYKETEYIAELNILHKAASNINMRKLTIADTDDRNLLLECYRHSNPYSEFPSSKCEELVIYYGLEFEKDNFYSFPDYNLIVVANFLGKTLFVQDIYGTIQEDKNKMLILENMLLKIAEYNVNTDHSKDINTEKSLNVNFGFTPIKEIKGVLTHVLTEADHTLYLLKPTEDLFHNNKLRFPVLSIN